MTRDEMHNEVAQQFESNPITAEGYEAAIKALKIVWKRNESQAAQDVNRMQAKVKALENTIKDQVNKLSDEKYSSIHDEILKSIDAKKQEILTLEDEALKLSEASQSDEAEFLEFAYDFIENTGKHFLDTKTVTKENRVRCKQLVFPSGFYLNEKNKVYTPEVSSLYRLAVTKKDTEVSDLALMVRVRRL